MIRPEITIKDFQVEGSDYLIKHNYSICADEQGLGKTLESIIVQQYGDYETLVACPATLKLGWKEEFHFFTDIEEKDVVVGLKKAKVNIVNYENIYRCSELFRKAQLVIIDEAHYLIHLDSQRTTYVHRMIKKYKPERLLLLTGTPIKNRVGDFFSLLLLCAYSPVKNNGRLVSDKFKTQEAYNAFFCKSFKMEVTVRPKGKKSFKTKIVKYSGIKDESIPEIKDLMRFKMIRRLAKNVLDLPPLTFKDVIVSYKKNDQLALEFEKYQNGEAYNVSVKTQAAIAVAPFTADYVRDIIKSGGGPVIIFSDHIEPLEIIEKRLRKSKFKMGKITGRVKIADRDTARKAFQAGNLDVILCSAGAANTGITLTASRNMVLNDLPWDWAMLRQLLKRFHRIGQEWPCVVHRMIGTIVYKRILANLSEKQIVNNKILGEDE